MRLSLPSLLDDIKEIGLHSAESQVIWESWQLLSRLADELVWREVLKPLIVSKSHPGWEEIVESLGVEKCKLFLS